MITDQQKIKEMPLDELREKAKSSDEALTELLSRHSAAGVKRIKDDIVLEAQIKTQEIEKEQLEKELKEIESRGGEE